MTVAPELLMFLWLGTDTDTDELEDDHIDEREEFNTSANSLGHAMYNAIDVAIDCDCDTHVDQSARLRVIQCTESDEASSRFTSKTISARVLSAHSTRRSQTMSLCQWRSRSVIFSKRRASFVFCKRFPLTIKWWDTAKIWSPQLATASGSGVETKTRRLSLFSFLCGKAWYFMQ